jgi:hypothetical protein
MDCHVATIAVHVSIEDYHVAINADHVSIEDCHVARNADHVAIDACHVVINADHVSIEDYHVAINADHVAIDACHVVINAGQTRTTSFPRKHLDLVLIQFVFLRVGLTAAMRTYWIPRANHEQRKLLENSMAFHTGCTVSE